MNQSLRPLGSRYQIGPTIGHGAMGQVFSGVGPEGEPLAFKVLHPHLTNDPEMVRRFVTERSSLTKVNHPNVVRVRDLVIEGDTLAIVMELVHGPDLHSWLASHGTLPPAEVARLGSLVSAGLGAIHVAGICHRDIKPANVLLDTTTGAPQPKVTDFGVVKLVGEGDRSGGATVLAGTPHYIAPELVLDAQPTPKSDLYSLGIMLYELSFGVTPFQSSNMMSVLKSHCERAPLPPEHADPRLWELISQLLHKDPAQRPGSAEEVRVRLQRLEAELAGVPPLPKLAQPPPSVPVAPGVFPVNVPPSPPTVAGRQSAQTITGLQPSHPIGERGWGQPGPGMPWSPGSGFGLVPTEQPRHRSSVGVAIVIAALASALILVLGVIAGVVLYNRHNSVSASAASGATQNPNPSGQPAAPQSQLAGPVTAKPATQQPATQQPVASAPAQPTQRATTKASPVAPQQPAYGNRGPGTGDGANWPPYTYYGPSDLCTTPTFPQSGMIRVGDSGYPVQSASYALIALGYEGVDRDTYFDSATSAALQRFQGNHGLTPDGILGPASWDMLRSRLYYYEKC